MKDLSYKLFSKAFSNKTRFEIINLLKKGPKNVTEICKELGFEQSRVSHNIRCLENCGFVSSERKKKNILYSLNGEIVPILKSIDKHIAKYQDQLVQCGILKRKV